MEKILSDFGVQPILLAAQAVNFFVLLFILKRFMYKPLLKVLEERKQRIAESLKNAEEIERKLAQTEEDRENKLIKATEEAQKIIEEATKNASEIISEAHVKASSDIEDLVIKAHEQIKMDREKMQAELREELGEIVSLSMQKITGKILTKKDQESLVKETIRKL